MLPALPSLNRRLDAEVEDHDIVLRVRVDRLREDALRAVVDAVGRARIDHASIRLTRLHAQRRRDVNVPAGSIVLFNLNVQVEKSKRPSSC